ncbi:MAG: protease complex subunit PrcB family protein [Clostridia bacterium]|nr:protease complex subunit PrcB family protein [Clostridia bacterium]
MTGGYSIKIESANLDGDTLYLVCKTSSPRPTDYVTQAITYPSYTIEVSRVIKNVHIEYYSDQQQSIGFTSDG